MANIFNFSVLKEKKHKELKKLFIQFIKTNRIRSMRNALIFVQICSNQFKIQKGIIFYFIFIQTRKLVLTQQIIFFVYKQTNLHYPSMLLQVNIILVCCCKSILSLCVVVGQFYHCVLLQVNISIVCCCRSILSLCVVLGQYYHCVLLQVNITVCCCRSLVADCSASCWLYHYYSEYKSIY